MAKVGYIYVRTHEAYDLYGVCKLGKTQNITNRETTYITGEFVKGDFSYVFEVPLAKMSYAEKKLGEDFKSLGFHERRLNRGRCGGKEFYKKEIIPLIKEQLQKHDIEARQLTYGEIESIARKEYIAKIAKYINKKSIRRLIKKLKALKNRYTKRSDQIEIIDKSVKHFQTNDKGLLVLICGIGKTLISLWTTQELKANKILVGVPNTLLLVQWEKVIKELFPAYPCLIVKGGVIIEDITLFLKKNEEKCIIITTYASSHKVCSASVTSAFRFDMKILDEVHHLTSHHIIKEEHKTYVKILDIKSVKQLSLTATLKIIENKDNVCDDDLLISNTNVAYFGTIIDKFTLLKAIEKQIVCDYCIQTLYSDADQLNELALVCNNTIKDEETDNRLLLSAYTSLKSICEGHSHHLLIYVNSKENALKVNSYIEKLISEHYFSVDDLYCSNYDSSMNKVTQENILANFQKATFGIITCVYCLGEGWDFPLLDAVVFAENMTSNIRIVQSALRASRKNAYEPDKLTKIILPIIDFTDNNSNPDLKKVKEVIYQMGLEDETINYKIKAFRVEIPSKPDPRKPRPRPGPIPPDPDFDEKLTQELRLKTVKRCALGTSYEKAKKIIAENNIKTKEDYYALTLRMNKLPDDPEMAYKGVFTNWIDYLSIDRVYYDLKTCKTKVQEYLANETSIDFELTNITKNLKSLDNKFPPCDLWCDYYDINDLTEIIKETSYELVDF